MLKQAKCLIGAILGTHARILTMSSAFSYTLALCKGLPQPPQPAKFCKFTILQFKVLRMRRAAALSRSRGNSVLETL